MTCSKKREVCGIVKGRSIIKGFVVRHHNHLGTGSLVQKYLTWVVMVMGDIKRLYWGVPYYQLLGIGFGHHLSVIWHCFP